MYQIKTSYMLPDGHTIDKVLEYQTRDSAEETFDRWYKAYKICQEDGKILVYSMVLTEVHELYSVLSGV